MARLIEAEAVDHLAVGCEIRAGEAVDLIENLLRLRLVAHRAADHDVAFGIGIDAQAVAAGDCGDFVLEVAQRL